MGSVSAVRTMNSAMPRFSVCEGVSRGRDETATDLRDLVGALLELLVVRRLLNNLEDLVGELRERQIARARRTTHGRVREREGLRVDLGRHRGS